MIKFIFMDALGGPIGRFYLYTCLYWFIGVNLNSHLVIIWFEMWCITTALFTIIFPVTIILVVRQVIWKRRHSSHLSDFLRVLSLYQARMLIMHYWVCCWQVFAWFQCRLWFIHFAHFDLLTDFRTFLWSPLFLSFRECYPGALRMTFSAIVGISVTRFMVYLSWIKLLFYCILGF